MNLDEAPDFRPGSREVHFEEVRKLRVAIS
jgi:hypothetical protein